MPDSFWPHDADQPAEQPGPPAPGQPGPGQPHPPASQPYPAAWPGQPQPGGLDSPWYGAYQWASPAPPRRGRARLHLAWLGATLAVAIVVGAAGYDLGTHSKTATAPPQHPAAGGAAATSAPPAGPPPCAASVTASIGDSRLLSELLPVPPGATRPTGSPAPKVYTLNAYVAALYAPGPVAIQEKALLTGRCFQTAVNGQWLTSTGTLVSIWLVQFAVTSGAESYALGQQNKDVQLMGAHGRTKLVRGVRAAADRGQRARRGRQHHCAPVRLRRAGHDPYTRVHPRIGRSRAATRGPAARAGSQALTALGRAGCPAGQAAGACHHAVREHDC